jgi:hypothetical protein
MKKILSLTLALAMVLSMAASLAFFQLPSTTDLTDQFDLIAVRAIDGTGLTGIRNEYEIVDATRVFVYDEVISICATVQVNNWYKNYAALAYAKEDYQLVITSDTIDFEWAYATEASVVSQIYSAYLGTQNARIYPLTVDCDEGTAVIDLITVPDTISGTDSLVFDYGWDGVSTPGANGIGAANEIVRLSGYYGPSSIQYHYIVNGVTKAPATGVEGNVSAYLIAQPAEAFAATTVDGIYEMTLDALNLKVRKYTAEAADYSSLLSIFQGANLVRSGATDFAGDEFTWSTGAYAAPSYAFYELIDVSGSVEVQLAVLGTEVLNNYNYYLEQGLGMLALQADASGNPTGGWLPAVLTMNKVQVDTGSGLAVAANSDTLESFLAIFGMNLGLGDIRYLCDDDFEKLGAEAVLKSHCSGTYKYGNSVEIVEEVVDEPTEEEEVVEEEEPLEEEEPIEEEEPVVVTGDASSCAALALVASAIVAAAALALVVKKSR